MSARVTWSGLTELRKALLDLPDALKADAAAIVVGAAADARDEIVTKYRAVMTPTRSARQRNRTRTKTRKVVHLADATSMTVPDTNTFGVVAIVKNTAPHVFLYEHGTEARHTDLGYNRGAVAKSTPPGRVFVPAMIRHRRLMYEALRDLLVSHGLTVSGDA